MNETSTIAFWDKQYAEVAQAPHADIPQLERSLRFLGDVRGKTIIDIGAGRGGSSLYLASKGANVIAVDTSEVAINELNATCKAAGIGRVRGVCMSAVNIGELGPADAVYGAMILHHLEPFGAFVDALWRTLKPGGKAFFAENSANSRLLVWFRQNIVGRFGIPKHGDPDEFPLTPQEVDLLRARFSVEVAHPEMVFFGLAAVYFLRGKGHKFFGALDRFCERNRLLLDYSYRQDLMLQKPPA